MGKGKNNKIEHKYMTVRCFVANWEGTKTEMATWECMRCKHSVKHPLNTYPEDDGSQCLSWKKMKRIEKKDKGDKSDGSKKNMILKK